MHTHIRTQKYIQVVYGACVCVHFVHFAADGLAQRVILLLKSAIKTKVATDSGNTRSDLAEHETWSTNCKSEITTGNKEWSEGSKKFK